MRKQKVLIVLGVFIFILLIAIPLVIFFNISSSQPQAPFFIDQRYVELRIYPDAQVVCQKFPNGWYCNGFDYIDQSLLQVVDFKTTYVDKIPAVLKMTGLNKKVNKVVGRRYLNEKEEETSTSADKKTNRTTGQDNER